MECKWTNNQGTFWYKPHEEAEVRAYLAGLYGTVCKEHGGFDEKTGKRWGYFTYRSYNGCYPGCQPESLFSPTPRSTK